MREANGQIERLGDEITKIKEEAEVEGRKEKERVVSEAKREAERIKRLTKEEIEMFVKEEVAAQM